MENINRFKLFVVIAFSGAALGIIVAVVKKSFGVDNDSTVGLMMGGMVVGGAVVLLINLLIKKVHEGKLQWLLKDTD